MEDPIEKKNKEDYEVHIDPEYTVRKAQKLTQNSREIRNLHVFFTKPKKLVKFRDFLENGTEGSWK